MEIRKATLADVPAIVDLWKEFIDFHSELDRFFTRSKNGHTEFARSLRDHLRDEDWRVLVATDGDEVIGYCVSMVMSYPPVFQTTRFGFIQDMAVTAARRRTGVGTRLFDAAAGWLERSGIERIELNASSFNETSLAFWRRMGFGDFVQRLAKDRRRAGE